MALIVITLLDKDGVVQVESKYDPTMMQDEPTPAAILAAQMLAVASEEDAPRIELLM